VFKKIWKFLSFDDSAFKEVVKQHLDAVDSEADAFEQRCQAAEIVEPLEVNAGVKYSIELTKVMNGPFLRPPFNMADAPTLHKLSAVAERVYIYNISPMEHEKDHPTFKTVKIPACPVGVPYKLAFSIPSMLVRTDMNVCQNDEITFQGTNGVRVAMDIVNPDNLTLNQWWEPSPYAYSIGNDLGVKGVFWSLRNPPFEEDLENSKKKYRKHCRSLLEQAGTKIYSAKAPFLERVQFFIKKGLTETAALQEAQREVQITPEHHAAAEYLRAKSVWHPVLEKKVKK
jgi:hypothetical protein